MSPTILFMTPVVPSPTGGGTPMRAAALLECLARIGRVIVVHIECWQATPDVTDRSWCRSRAEAVVTVPVSRLPAIPDLVTDVLAAAGLDGRIDAVYAFRQIVGPSAVACRQRFRPRLMLLDLDDDESHLDRQLAEIQRALGDVEGSAALVAGERRRWTTRAMLLPHFDRIFLSNPSDVASLREQHPEAPFDLLVNVLPPVTVASVRVPDPMRMLFLGTLTYPPNEEGVAWFIRDVLPRIRESEPNVHLRVAGIGLPDRLVPLLATEGVVHAGAVPDVAPEYAAAGIAVVPLRAGSGTRIKLLEAFRHGTPVVSTSIGAAGLDVVDGEHILIADDDDSFARQCLRLMRDADLREVLSRNAAHWIARHHSPDVMCRALADVLSST